jgi:hypothetical protein
MVGLVFLVFVLVLTSGDAANFVMVESIATWTSLSGMSVCTSDVYASTVSAWVEDVEIDTDCVDAVINGDYDIAVLGLLELSDLITSDPNL